MSNFWFCEIKKSDILPPRKFEKISRICKFSIENPAIFCHFWGQKYNSKSINFFIFGRDFGRFFIFYPILMALKKLRGFANFDQKIQPLSVIFRVKNTLVHPSIFSFLDVILDEFWPFYPILMAFLGQFLIFSPKKQIFKSKSSKKLKVQKWCQNGSNSII